MHAAQLSRWYSTPERNAGPPMTSSRTSARSGRNGRVDQLRALMLSQAAGVETRRVGEKGTAGHREEPMPDVIKLLEQDHREVEDLFAKAESTSGAAKQDVVTKICTELTIHAEVEESIVYPAMRESGLADLVAEAEE